MNKKTKKLIALLSIGCVASVLAGCGAAEAKSTYQIAVENGFTGTEAEWAASLAGLVNQHKHAYGDEITVVTEPTGVSDGLGYKVCPTDGDKEYVVLAKLAGVVAKNPIELTAGVKAVVDINDYDSDTFGVDNVNGEKNVMYFAITSQVDGYISFTDNLPEGVSVAYTFYTDNTLEYESSRFISIDTTDPKPVTRYVKAVYSSDPVLEYMGEVPVPVPDTVELTANFTVTDNQGKVKNTISLSQGEAEGVTLRVEKKWSYIDEDGEEVVGWSEEQLFLDRNKDTWEMTPEELEAGDPVVVKGNYVPFGNGTDAEVWLAPDGEYRFFVEDLATGLVVADQSTCAISYGIDGANDEGVDVEVKIGNTYTFNITVTDSEDTPIAGAVIMITDSYGNPSDYVLNAEDGTASITLPQTLDGEGNLVLDYGVVVSNLGFGMQEPNIVVLSADTLDVTIQAEAATVGTWVAGTESTLGTAYPVLAESGVNYGKVTLTADTAGKYTVALNCEDSWFAGDEYIITINGVEYVVGKVWEEVYALKATAVLNEGDNEITVATADGEASSMYEINVTVDLAVAPNAIELDEPKTISDGKSYVFTAPKEGEYTFMLSAGEGQSSDYAQIYESQAAYDNWDDPLNANGWDLAQEFKVLLKEGEEQTVWVFNESDLTITVAWAPADYQVLTLNQEQSVANGSTYYYTAPATATYTFIVSAKAGQNVRGMSIFPSKADAEMFSNVLYNPRMGGSFTIDMTEGQVQSFYIVNQGYDDQDQIIDLGATFMVSGKPAPTEIELDKATALEKGVEYAFTATTSGVYFFTTNGDAENYVRLTETEYYLFAGEFLYYSAEQQYGAIIVEEGKTYTFYASVLVGSVELTIQTEAPDGIDVEDLLPEEDDNGGNNGGNGGGNGGGMYPGMPR